MLARQTSSLVTSLKLDELAKGLFLIDVANLPDTFIDSPKNQFNMSNACVPKAPITPPPFSSKEYQFQAL